MGQEKTHLQEQGFRIGEGPFDGAPCSKRLGGALIPLSLPLAKHPQVVERHGHGMGQVEGGVDLSGRDVEQVTSLKEFVIGEAPILPAKDKGHPLVRVLAWLVLHKPSKSISWRSQWQRRTLQPTRCRHHPGTIGKRGG
jgi:hypothetical protein